MFLSNLSDLFESSQGVYSESLGLQEGKWVTRADGESGVRESAVCLAVKSMEIELGFFVFVFLIDGLLLLLHGMVVVMAVEDN